MTRPELLLLINEYRVRQQIPDLLGLVSHDHKNPGRDRLSSAKDVFDQGAAPHPMQHLCFARSHSGAFPRSQNQDLQILHHTPSIA
jgi:hypothetical protein